MSNGAGVPDDYSWLPAAGDAVSLARPAAAAGIVLLNLSPASVRPQPGHSHAHPWKHWF